MRAKRADKAHKDSGGNYLFRITVALVTMLIVAAGAVMYFKQNAVMRRLDDEARAMQDQLDILIREHEDLSRRHHLLGSDEYYEAMARDTLDMVKPGEILIIPGD